MSKHDLPSGLPPKTPETPIEDLIPLMQIPLPPSEWAEGPDDPRAAKAMQWAHDQLSKTYARIDELREELRIVESALRLKDPVTKTMTRDTPAFRLPKTQLTFEETKELLAVRQELRDKVATLEQHRDALERDFLPPEDAEGMRKARADIEAIPEEDLAFGGDAIEDPSYGQHVARRALEKYNKAAGFWHVQQGIKWFLEKTGLKRPVKELGAWLNKKADGLDDWAKKLGAPKEGRKALPPGAPNESPDASYDAEASWAHGLIEDANAQLQYRESMGEPARLHTADLLSETVTLPDALGRIEAFLRTYPNAQLKKELEALTRRLSRRHDAVLAELAKRGETMNPWKGLPDTSSWAEPAPPSKPETPEERSFRQARGTFALIADLHPGIKSDRAANKAFMLESLPRVTEGLRDLAGSIEANLEDLGRINGMGLDELQRRFAAAVDVIDGYAKSFPSRPENAELEGIKKKLEWTLDEIEAALEKRGPAPVQDPRKDPPDLSGWTERTDLPKSGPEDRN